MNDNLNLSNLPTIPVAPEGFKSGFVGIIGRPNVGKSTLMNQLIGQKIAITSPVSQTTRNRLRGILTTEKAQIIFVDTPGIHKPHHSLGKIIVKNAKTAINAVDIILLVVDSSTKSGGGDRYIIDLLKTVNQPIILGLNKSDQQPENYQEIDESYASLIQDYNWPILKFSALTGDGLENLQNSLIEQLDFGPYYYPPDLITDQPERFIMGELIREQILQMTRQEIPHSVAIAIEKVEETPKVTKIFAAINVERNSQKGIMIGQKGSMLKAIGTAAREQIQKLIAGEVYLKLFVKVEPQWRQSNLRLAEFGYRVEE
ncbi:GTPase Era [Crocosphaera watsonii WH 8501]|uniref:GTPase Era n=4 Tax=Crocosphaera watsonii TaxID=263511 RepID=Q4C234_CROWT|nr:MULTISPECIES: GTPase Era [Crocosphaera]EAM50222.1 Small GTP-binding protein domain:GTP-binding:GTP-binding protein Era [Crocosphaera watsonii WH 8501]EHJ12081.1 GTP-binding protein Era [Crocosphaera watsonii WH 0003]MCH2244014.1 GTPase Era [Crocosphaera sp.]NQZ63242.1 GTPase Era [Crocosphaera sp.]CCQ54595.1 GTP-binding protein Era [Crocosphaera watsonii WH 0005]